MCTACTFVPPLVPDPTTAARKRMEPLLHDPKVQDALSDPRVKQIMQVLKADPEKAQRMLAEASPEVLEKIQCLSVLSDTVKEE